MGREREGHRTNCAVDDRATTIRKQQKTFPLPSLPLSSFLPPTEVWHWGKPRRLQLLRPSRHLRRRRRNNREEEEFNISFSGPILAREGEEEEDLVRQLWGGGGSLTEVRLVPCCIKLDRERRRKAFAPLIPSLSLYTAYPLNFPKVFFQKRSSYSITQCIIYAAVASFETFIIYYLICAVAPALPKFNSFSGSRLQIVRSTRVPLIDWTYLIVGLCNLFRLLAAPRSERAPQSEKSKKLFPQSATISLCAQLSLRPLKYVHTCEALLMDHRRLSTYIWELLLTPFERNMHMCTFLIYQKPKIPLFC